MINKFKQFWTQGVKVEQPMTFKKHWIGQIKKEDNVKWIFVRGHRIPVREGVEIGSALKEHYDKLRTKKKEKKIKLYDEVYKPYHSKKDVEQL